ncbi:MAG: 3-dehydroquinate synthase [Oscillospiraceae bacterium]|nr:3-dehydroquinate synthase [Oscillospiraceae bacterium]
MKTISVKTKQRCYDVLIGSGLLGDAGKLLSQVSPKCRVMLVSDDVVHGLYGEPAAESFRRSGFSVSEFVFEHGERSKNLTVCAALLERMAQEQLTRTDMIAALGGGVTGDLAGFAASAYLRGVRFANFPTTLLACVDSSVGGKTGVNLSAGKNLAGAFWQPSLVVCDTDTLSTLPPDVLADGIAESVKYGMIRDAELFSKLRDGTFLSNLEDGIAACVSIKNEIVGADELDRGQRQLLNFGHTAGHAIERASGYGISHGHAVAIGMAVISRAFERLGEAMGCSAPLLEALEGYGLPVTCGYDAAALAEHALRDKKRGGDEITLVVPKRVGECVLRRIPVSELKNIFELGLE